MQPKKKDFMDYLVPILIVVLVAYLTVQSAVCVDIAVDVYNERAVEISAERGLAIDSTTVDGLAKREAFSAFAEAFEDRISNHADELVFTSKSLPKLALIVGFAMLLIFGYIYTSRKKYISGKEFGTARWATAKDLAKYRAKYVLKEELKKIRKKYHGIKRKTQEAEAKIKHNEYSEIIYTATERASMYSSEMANNNTLVIGGSGSRKTTGYVNPNILQCNASPYSPSLVVTDPKGEIVGNMGKYLESVGYDVVVLDLKEQEKSFCFNPFMYISDDKYDKQIPWVVQNLMKCKEDDSKNKGSQEPFWDEMTELVLTALSFAVYMGFPKEEQNIGTVAELYSWFEVNENDDREKNPTKLDKFFIQFGDADGVNDMVEAIIAFYKNYINLFDDDTASAVLPKPQCLKPASELREKIGLPIGTDSGVLIDSIQAEIARLTLSASDSGHISQEVAESSENAINEIMYYKNARKTNYEGLEKPAGVQIYERFGVKGYSNPALKYWDDFRNNVKGKTAQSACATVIGKLAPFSEFQIKRIMSKDQMRLDEMGERKIALFVVLPPTEKRYNFIVTILYSLLFQRLEYCATVTHRDIQRLPVPVKFILDEFYNTGEIKNFLNILSYARSFGISISIILQSLDQIKEMYEKTWGLIIDNCSALLYLGGIRHYDTLKYISDLLGKGTFDKKTQSRTKGRQSSSTTNNDKIGRELMTPDELQTMPRDKCVLFLAGIHAFYSTKFYYKGHRNFKYTLMANKKNLYEYSPPEDDNLPRGEEVIAESEVSTNAVNKNETTIVPISRPHIRLGTEEETINELSMNLVDYELSGEDVDDSEVEDEFELIAQKIKEKETARSRAEAEEIKKVVTPHIELCNVAETAQTISDILSSEKPLDEITLSDGEEVTDEEVDNFFNEYVPMSVEDEWEDDSDEKSLLEEFKSLSADISGSFLEALSSENGEDLQEGIIKDDTESI